MASALLLLLLLAAARAQDDFDLGDALATPSSRKPAGDAVDGGDLDLSDALGGRDTLNPDPPRPPRPPEKKPGHSDTGISDSDLMDVVPGGGSGGRHGGGGGVDGGPGREEPAGTPEGVVPAVVSSVLVALVGVASGYAAYYKRKLCFKRGGDQPGDVEMAAGAESPVQRTLLKR